MNNPKFISFAESGIDFIDGDRGTNYPSKSELIANGYCVFLNTGNVKKTGFDFTQVEFIDEEKDKKLRKGKVRQGDIVLTTRGTVGNVALVTSDTPFKNIRINSGMVIVRTDPEKYDPYFILLFFRSSLFQKQCLSHGSGSAQPQLPISALKYISFPNIDIDHQKKVVSAASCIDKKIELNNRINAELEAMAKTLYDYWFVQFDFPDANGKPYKTSGGKMVYNPTLKREIPEGWEVVSLTDIATFTNGIACQKYFPKEDETGVYKVIKIREFSSGLDENSDMVIADVPEELIIQNGDVLFSWSATLDVKLWAGGVGALNQHIFKVTSDSYPKTFYYFEVLRYLEHFKMIAALRKTTMGHITKDHLAWSRISLPPRGLIEEMDKKLSPMLEKIVSNNQQNMKLTKLRDWLLPMLMNGQVTVI